MQALRISEDFGDEIQFPCYMESTDELGNHSTYIITGIVNDMFYKGTCIDSSLKKNIGVYRDYWHKEQLKPIKRKTLTIKIK